MQILRNYEYLLSISADIEKQVNASPSFGAFNKDKIDAFYSNNREQLDEASGIINGLLDEYVQKDEKGKPLSIGFNGHTNWAFKNSEAAKLYHEEYQAFIKLSVTIYI